MFLYGLTLQRGGQITCCCHGQFSGTKQQVRNMLSINANTCDPIVTRRKGFETNHAINSVHSGLITCHERMFIYVQPCVFWFPVHPYTLSFTAK